MPAFLRQSDNNSPNCRSHYCPYPLLSLLLLLLLLPGVGVLVVPQSEYLSEPRSEHLLL